MTGSHGLRACCQLGSVAHAPLVELRGSNRKAGCQVALVQARHACGNAAEFLLVLLQLVLVLQPVCLACLDRTILIYKVMCALSPFIPELQTADTCENRGAAKLEFSQLPARDALQRTKVRVRC